MILAACSGGDGSSTPTTEVTGEQVSTEDVRLVMSDDPRASEILTVVEDALEQSNLQTVAFGVWDGDTEVIRGAVDAPGPMVPTHADARVRVGQPMEAMLGTILLQLDQDGILTLDESVAQYLPDLVNGESITPRMLANSTSGTPDYIPNEAFQEAFYADPFQGWTAEDLLGYAQQSPPLFAPGEGWAYSHTNFALLGEVMEQASGQAVAELFESRIFEPLGMDTAKVDTTNAIGSPAFHAFTHERDVYEESTSWNPTWALNSGNMYASVSDVGRWLRALNSGELLGEPAFELQMAPNTAGLGPFDDQRYFTFGSMASDRWLAWNPSLQGYMGLAAQQRDPSVTIVVYSTSAADRTATDNASVAIATAISAIVSPGDPLVVPTG